MVVLGGKGQHFELEHGGTELKRTQICPPGSRKYTLKNTRKTQFFYEKIIGVRLENSRYFREISRHVHENMCACRGASRRRASADIFSKSLNLFAARLLIQENRGELSNLLANN